MSCGTSKETPNTVVMEEDVIYDTIVDNSENIPITEEEETQVVVIEEVIEEPIEVPPVEFGDSRKGKLVDDFSPYDKSVAINILAVKVNGNVLVIDVSYSGGCEKHEFELIGSKSIQKSLPPKRGIKLYHNANGESCRELINQTLSFDISEFAYPGGEIMLLLEGYLTPISYVAK